MIIRTLIDDRMAPGAPPSLHAEHGLSLYVETKDRRILLDTGDGSHLIGNAAGMGVDLSSLDTVILSHGHKDHIGGLSSVLAANHHARIYLSKHIFQQFSMRVCGLSFPIGDNRSFPAEWKRRAFLVDQFHAIDDNIVLVSGFHGPLSRLLYAGGVRDDFPHELVFVIQTGCGAVIFTGCCHSGLPAILQRVSTLLPNAFPCTIIGGLHLIPFPKFGIGRIDAQSMEVLIRMVQSGAISKIYTCHCTGKRPFEKLRQELGSKVQYIGTGSVISISS